MKRMEKKFATAAVMLLIILGIVGCSGRRDISEDEIGRETFLMILIRSR